MLLIMQGQNPNSMHKCVSVPETRFLSFWIAFLLGSAQDMHAWVGLLKKKKKNTKQK